MKSVIIIAIAFILLIPTSAFAQSSDPLQPPGFGPPIFLEEKKIPDWVRNIFLWYGQEQISENELLGAIKYLIDKEIIDVPTIKSLEDENNLLKQKIRGLESSLASNKEYQANLQDALIEEKQQSISIAEDALKSQIQAMARTNPFLNGVITGTLNIYFQPVPSYAADGVSEVVAIYSKSLDGIEFYKMKLRVVSNPNDADITINWLKDFGSAKLGHAIFRSVVEVGIGEDNCHGDWQAYNALTVHKILIHELGHSLGFNHSTKSNNIMYPTIQSQFSTDIDKTFELDEGDYKTFSFCNSGSMNYYLSSDDQNNGFYAYVLPSTTDASQFLNGVGQYNQSCSTEDPMISFSKTCNIGIGDKLLVYNKDDVLQFGSIRLNLKVLDLNTMPTPDFSWDLDAFAYDFKWLVEVYDIFH